MRCQYALVIDLLINIVEGIDSLPGQWLAGVVLGMLVWLTFEITDRGTPRSDSGLYSFREFLVSVRTTLSVGLLIFIMTAPWHAVLADLKIWPIVPAILVANVLPGYAILLGCHVIKPRTAELAPVPRACIRLAGIVAAAYITVATTLAWFFLLSFISEDVNREFAIGLMRDQLTFANGSMLHFLEANIRFVTRRPYLVLPTLAPLIWLCLRGVSQFLLTAVQFRRFGNANLSPRSVGGVAGALATVAYWGFLYTMWKQGNRW